MCVYVCVCVWFAFVSGSDLSTVRDHATMADRAFAATRAAGYRVPGSSRTAPHDVMIRVVIFGAGSVRRAALVP